MIDEIIKRIIKTEDCRILDFDAIQKINSIKNYQDVIEVKTEITLQSGVQDIILYVGIPNPAVTLPKIFISSDSYDDIKFIPHINKDLNICVYDEGVNHVFNELYLPDIIEELINRAKSIITQVDEPQIMSVEFEKEFKAYWEMSYDKNDSVNEIGLSIIENDLSEHKGYFFNSAINGFKYLIYQESRVFEAFKNYLDHRHINYSDIDVFVIEYLQKTPPFHLSFEESTKYIKDSDLKRFKQAINRNGMHKALVIFKNIQGEYFGWVYSRTIPALSIIKGWHNNLSSWQILKSPTFIKSLVERVIFSGLTPERLEKRTSGYFTENKIAICIIGLGSVGSNLLNYLMKLPINRFHLIDSDILLLENIYRHQYGFDKIKMAKVDIAKDNILNKDPFSEVISSKNSVIDMLCEVPSLLNEYDLNFLVVGNTMTEKFILEHLVKNGCDKPLVIMWVEPFMASGQMLYICPDDFNKAKEFILNFPYSVLKESDKSQIYLKEGSCQTGYFPYSESNLTLFLSSVFPYLFRIIKNNEKHSSKVFTWIGDKDFIEKRGLTLSKFATSTNSFELLVKNL